MQVIITLKKMKTARYGLYSCGLYSCGLYSYGVYSYGLYTYGHVGEEEDRQVVRARAQGVVRPAAQRTKSIQAECMAQQGPKALPCSGKIRNKKTKQPDSPEASYVTEGELWHDCIAVDSTGGYYGSRTEVTPRMSGRHDPWLTWCLGVGLQLSVSVSRSLCLSL